AGDIDEGARCVGAGADSVVDAAPARVFRADLVACLVCVLRDHTFGQSSLVCRRLLAATGVCVVFPLATQCRAFRRAVRSYPTRVVLRADPALRFVASITAGLAIDAISHLNEARRNELALSGAGLPAAFRPMVHLLLFTRRQ